MYLPGRQDNFLARKLACRWPGTVPVEKKINKARENLSDKYGRRFPLISGLFTSGLMMLGFGLSTTVRMCAFFRFMHGLFNGNVMVAKTMMADITAHTNFF
ncbi:hypothetical protein GH5_01065 [Leishmania sp. Ghana 2012 LV757]|uniref:hypothetical protein n=1 Tax=Leishmania sp. Ghana 2012 LV757 TaxID=2803181 RepID=UPI001B4477D2|nr:hypothetical protein GH5_01065 [Leishmania sp. Ghana 2012 LV757]